MVVLLSRWSKIVYFEVFATVFGIENMLVCYVIFLLLLLSFPSQLQLEILKQLSFVLPDYICGTGRKERDLLKHLNIICPFVSQADLFVY